MLSAAKPCDGNIVMAQAPAMKALESIAVLGFGRSRTFKKVCFVKLAYLNPDGLQQELLRFCLSV